MTELNSYSFEGAVRVFLLFIAVALVLFEVFSNHDSLDHVCFPAQTGVPMVMERLSAVNAPATQADTADSVNALPRNQVSIRG